jgi:hypothetical protein
MKIDVTKRKDRRENIAVDKALPDLIRVSNAVGKDPALVQGGAENSIDIPLLTP